MTSIRRPSCRVFRCLRHGLTLTSLPVESFLSAANWGGTQSILAPDGPLLDRQGKKCVGRFAEGIEEQARVIVVLSLCPIPLNP
ncbi:hypothetical protein BDP81DRAFT_434107 [Colletotrichum phormii]|uniref:Uncharacterized protein n=1 Tax=Colletotrichum phormii TaxID=359342 RepID=A0AAJ0EE35_9PEZI|nr:uncharacterized protein BDP81DRAFT_434107 [Colletotrichum phormii]KAK1633595.1 hypothetical protein BDP81DRAFT_434107 [Colletotrichum phormii]